MKRVHHVDVLVRLLVHAIERRLPGDRHQRGAVHVGVGHAGDQVGGAGTEGGQADARLAGEPAVHVGHEGAALFVAHADEANRRVDQGVHHGDVLLPGQAEDVFDVFVFPDSERADPRLSW